MKTYLAVDISASQGHIALGTVTAKGVELQTVKQFALRPVSIMGNLYWNVMSLFEEILDALKTLSIQGVNPVSIGIDTFGMDFCCFGSDGQLLSQPHSFLQPVTDETITHFTTRLSRRKVYSISGMQPLNYAALYRLDAMRQEGNTALSVSKRIMFIADTLAYMLTGECTVNSTTASAGILTNANYGALDDTLLAHVGLTTKNFGSYTEPGMTIGTLTDEVRRLTGCGEIPVVSVAAYDIASSVVAAPSTRTNFAYIVSGDISAAGLETDTPITSENAEQLGLSNQYGAYGTTCMQSLVGGKRLLDNVIDELGMTYEEAMTAAKNNSNTQSTVNVDANDFLAPVSTVKAIELFCKKTAQPVPNEKADIIKCIIDSLAVRYYEIITAASNLKDEKPREIFFLGEQTSNDALLQSIANMTGLTVVTGEKQAAATGNIMVQAIANKEANSIWDLRAMQAKSDAVRRITPTND